MKNISTTILAAALAVGLSACGATATPSPDKNSEEGLSGQEIAVAFDVNGPPFAYVESGDKVAGFDVDLLDEIAKRNNFTLKKSAMPFDGILAALQANQSTVGSGGMTITDERKKVVLFSTPYFQTGMALATKPDASLIETVEDLKGKSVAVRTGSTHALYLESLPFADEIKIHTYDSTNDQFQAVISGIDDAGMNDKAFIDFYIAQRGGNQLEVVGELLTKDNYGFPILMDRSDVKTTIDETLIEMANDGTYARMYEKYFGVEPDLLPGDID